MKKNAVRLSLISLGMVVAGMSMANLTPYSQNFESMTLSAPDALSSAGWVVYGNVFDSGGNYLYGYGTFPAPNGTPGFCSVATGEAGPEQGLQYINVYSDYNNVGAHGAGQLVEANVFQEQIVGLADPGRTYRFRFDYKASSQVGPAGSTVTRAFIKVLDPSSGYALVAFPNVVTTLAPTNAWVSNSIDITIQPGWIGNIFQFGFMSTATQFQNSGVYYDNVNFAALPASGTLSGTVNLNDFVGDRAGRTVSIRITATGSSTALFNGSATLNSSGGYSVTVPGLSAGQYDLYIDGTPFLRKKQTLAWTATGASGVTTTLLNGDCDNSGEVDAADIDLVIAAFGAVVGNGNYSISVDVDGSAEVDAADIDVVIANFGATDQ